MSDKKLTINPKRIVLRVLGLLFSTVPVAAATLLYFPLWRERGGAAALSGEGITDYTICGMGGELIAEIIGRADFLRKEDIRLIVQPMSKFAVLRRELASLGYETEAEEYSASQGKLYLTLCASYTGEARTITDAEAEFGKEEFLSDITGAKREFLERRADALKRAADGKARGGEDSSSENTLYAYLNKFLGR